jgi:hypothetical protein
MRPSPASLPQPTEARLLRGAQGGVRGKPPKPPLGLRRWSVEAGPGVAIVVALELADDSRASDPDDVHRVAAQVPLADALPEGTLVVVLERAERSSGLVSRLLSPRPRVPLAVRGSALLARGYGEIGAGVDPSSGEELAWGHARGGD